MKTALATIFAMTLATSAVADNTGTPGDAVERYKGIFTQLDTDTSQSLSTEEAAMAGLSGDSFSRLDANADGSLSLEEFLVLASEPEATGSETGDDAMQDTHPQ